MIHVSAQVSSPIPASEARADSPSLDMLSGAVSGPGRRKVSKLTDTFGNFAKLVKTLLEGIKAPPALAEAQIPEEKPASGSGKAKGPKLTPFLQDKDVSTLTRAKNTAIEASFNKKEAAKSPVKQAPKEQDGGAQYALLPALAQNPAEQKALSPAPLSPVPPQSGAAEEALPSGESLKKEARSLADLVRNRAGPFNEALQAEVPVRAGRIGFPDLEKTAKSEKKAETGVKERRRERFAKAQLEIRDFRPENVKAAGAEEGHRGSFSQKNLPETEISVDFSGGRARQGAEPDQAPAAFHDMLSRELRGELGQDLVRHASLILKEGGEGLIRLNLKPETLGNVKIRLELSENKVSGRIIVENTDALRAFERELPVLEAAFKDSGFEGASLELSQGRGDGTEKQRDEKPFYSERLAAASYDALSVSEARPSQNLYRTQINMLA